MQTRLLFALGCEVEAVAPGLWRVRLPDGMEGHPLAVEAVCQAEFGIDPDDPWGPYEE